MFSVRDAHFVTSCSILFLLMIISILCSCYHHHNHVHYVGSPDIAATIYETKWQVKLVNKNQQNASRTSMY
jgi:hypothetical protein